MFHCDPLIANIYTGRRAQLTRAPVALTTFAHFSISDVINSVACAGVPDLIVAPLVRSRVRTALSSSDLFNSLLSRVIIAAGVRAALRLAALALAHAALGALRMVAHDEVPLADGRRREAGQNRGEAPP